MSKKFPEYKGLDLSQVNKDILKKWEENNTFEKSVSSGDGKKEFIFYEGPPTANGLPHRKVIDPYVCVQSQIQLFPFHPCAKALPVLQTIQL